jgi:hypothetical protein
MKTDSEVRKDQHSFFLDQKKENFTGNMFSPRPLSETDEYIWVGGFPRWKDEIGPSTSRQ